MRNQGESYMTIAKAFGVALSTAQYHTNPDYREYEIKRKIKNYKKLYAEGKTWNQRHPEKWKATMRRINNARYRNDPEFRERQQKYCREYYHKRKNKAI